VLGSDGTPAGEIIRHGRLAPFCGSFGLASSGDGFGLAYESMAADSAIAEAHVALLDRSDGSVLADRTLEVREDEDTIASDLAFDGTSFVATAGDFERVLVRTLSADLSHVGAATDASPELQDASIASAAGHALIVGRGSTVVRARVT
jgi:hypothetical protein